MTEKTNTTNRKSPKWTLQLVAVVVLSFIAMLCFRRSAGVLAMLPISFLCCAAAAFIKIDLRIKLLVFGVSIFWINTVEQSDIKITLTYTLICIVACCLFELCAKLFRKNSKAFTITSALSCGLCIALSIGFIGNPITAISAGNKINDYTESKYPESTEEGEKISFTKIYYNGASGNYEIEATSADFPTESATISLDGERINDGFDLLLKQKLAEPYVLEITSVLRKYFPDDSFSVNLNSLRIPPEKSLVTMSENEIKSCVSYEISLGGVQTANAMYEKVERYISEIEFLQIPYSQITFKSGINPWVRRCVTIDSARAIGVSKYPLTHVPANSSDLFNEYMEHLLKIKK